MARSQAEKKTLTDQSIRSGCINLHLYGMQVATVFNVISMAKKTKIIGRNETTRHETRRISLNFHFLRHRPHVPMSKYRDFMSVRLSIDLICHINRIPIGITYSSLWWSRSCFLKSLKMFSELLTMAYWLQHTNHFQCSSFDRRYVSYWRAFCGQTAMRKR